MFKKMTKNKMFNSRFFSIKIIKQIKYQNMCIKVSWLKKNSVDILYFYEESPTLKNL